ncbi:hypothetical protein GCM10022225_79350 [Plantactinospora mayteni]|uniref:Knr4/Smi1-like domain-containing protein n=2 Tax=Plantactinospora mayteni TaxID=566021 RepID=A0ABQ4F398_9ACTN|nr:hypothetical protein Pma05_79630 [Plantactinospora mayteni]
MAARLAGAAPAGWRRVTLSGFADGQRTGSYLLTGGDGSVSDVSLVRDLRRLYKVCRTSDSSLIVKLTIDSSGWFEATMSSGSIRSAGDFRERGIRYILRSGTAVPDAGDEQPGPSDPAPAGDPAEAVRLLRQYREMGRRRWLDVELDEPSDVQAMLPPEFFAARLAEAEASMGVALPADLRALHQVSDGDAQEGVFGRLSWWVDMAEMVALHNGDRPWASRSSREDPFSFVRDPYPYAVVKRSVDRAGWIPFLLRPDGDYLAVDMDPAPGGRPGQVIRIGAGCFDGTVYIADSVTALLRQRVDALASAPPIEETEDWELAVEVRQPRVQSGNWHIEGTDASLHEIPSDVQKLTVENGGDIDLAPLRGAPLLRCVELTGRTQADLSPLRSVPLEILDLDLKTIDLAPLAGHPTLRAVKLTSPHPVDLSPLRSLSRLDALLVRASVLDIETIPDLDRLRYLGLRHRQWQELWERADRTPPLDVAGLSGKVSDDQVAEWVGRFPAAAEAQRHTGRWDM